MKILTTSDLSNVSGGWLIDENGDTWFDGSNTIYEKKWVGGFLLTVAYDAAVSGYRWAANNVANATDDSVTYNCNAYGSCW